jgi:hypothetical protein
MTECPLHPRLQLFDEGDVRYGLTCTHLDGRHVALEVFPPDRDVQSIEFCVEVRYGEADDDLERIFPLSSTEAWDRYQEYVQWLLDSAIHGQL